MHRVPVLPGTLRGQKRASDLDPHGVTPCGCWDLNLGPLQELLTDQPSLAPLCYLLSCPCCVPQAGLTPLEAGIVGVQAGLSFFFFPVHFDLL